MHGAEHKKRAEELLEYANSQASIPSLQYSALATAQVHATLALVESNLVLGQVSDWDSAESS